MASVIQQAEGGRADSLPKTLGDVLYADHTQARVSEGAWVALVRAIAAGDQRALRALYDRTHRVAFTFLARLLDDRRSAEQLTVDTFHAVWRGAARYDPANGPVVGWIMNQAQSRAIDRLRYEQRKKHAASASDDSSSSDGGTDTAGEAIWPTDLLRPSDSMWSRVLERVGEEAIADSTLPEVLAWKEPQWSDVAPGISCKLLAIDTERDRVSMLVRLAPDTAYPSHRHAGAEELFLLNGELWIEERKLHAGDLYRAEPGTTDTRVYSETGCTCVLTTSAGDLIS